MLIGGLASVHTNITNIKRKEGVQLRIEKLKLFASDIITLVGKSLGIYKVNVYNHERYFSKVVRPVMNTKFNCISVKF